MPVLRLFTLILGPLWQSDALLNGGRLCDLGPRLCWRRRYFPAYHPEVVTPGIGMLSIWPGPRRAEIDLSDRGRRRSLVFATAWNSRPRFRRLRQFHNYRPVGL